MNRDESNPYVRRPDNPNYLRRSRQHDYNRPARYLITLAKAAEIGNFCRIVVTAADSPQVEFSSTGLAFEKALKEWQGLYPGIMVQTYQSMPDHIHLCLDVRTYLPNGLSRAIARLMGRTLRAIDCGANRVLQHKMHKMNKLTNKMETKFNCFL